MFRSIIFFCGVGGFLILEILFFFLNCIFLIVGVGFRIVVKKDVLVGGISFDRVFEDYIYLL